MFSDMYGDNDSDTKCGDGMMFVDVEKFQTYVSHVSNDVKAICGGIHYA